MLAAEKKDATVGQWIAPEVMGLNIGGDRSYPSCKLIKIRSYTLHYFLLCSENRGSDFNEINPS